MNKKIKIEKIRIVVYIILLYFLLLSCSEEPPLRIALTKGKGSEHYLNYERWLRKYNNDIEFVDLYHISREEALKVLNECSGIVLTGGPDVHPFYYGKASDTIKCDIDLKRDSLEFESISLALKLGLPILAICRGEQILNVALKGSLIVDIPTDYDTLIKHKCLNPDTCYHDVMIIRNSLLYDISQVTQGVVNSNHHQAVDKLADDFIATAYSKDGIIEAYEWKDKTKKPFLIAVQWHPERLDSSNPLSYKIGKRYIDEVIKFYKNNVVKKTTYN